MAATGRVSGRAVPVSPLRLHCSRGVLHDLNLLRTQRQTLCNFRAKTEAAVVLSCWLPAAFNSRFTGLLLSD